MLLLACWLAGNGLWISPLLCLILERPLLLLPLPSFVLDLRLWRPRAEYSCTLPLIVTLLLLLLL